MTDVQVRLARGSCYYTIETVWTGASHAPGSDTLGFPVASARDMNSFRYLLIPLIALVASSSSLSAQQASYKIVGQGCRLGSNLGPVPLAVVGLPKLGGKFTLVTECSTRFVTGVWRNTSIWIGLSNQTYGGLKLPFDIKALFPNKRLHCGVLRTSCEAILAVPRYANYKTPAKIDFQVPNSVALLGFKFYQQVVSVEGDTFGHSALALSAGGEGVIGY
jgi:hypothetical protein